MQGLSLDQLIFNAVLSPHKHERQAAEKSVVELRTTNLSPFLLEVSKILLSPAYKSETRQAAAAVLTHSIKAKNQAAMFLWDENPVPVKDEIRNNLLQVLIVQDQKVKRSSANTISVIASIQLPRGEWADLIQILLGICKDGANDVKRTAIMTLGFICQQLKQNNMVLSESTNEEILASILLALRVQQPIPNRNQSLQALRDSIGFMRGLLLSSKSYRDPVISLVFEGLKDVSLVQNALQCLIQFSKSCYDVFGEYISAILAETTPIMQALNQNISILAIQIWNTLGFEYLERKNNHANRANNSNVPLENHLKKVKDVLPQVLMSCLLASDGDQNKVRFSAWNALCTLGECCGPDITSIVTTFVSNTLISPQVKLRQASILAFACLCESEDKNTIRDLLSKVYESFVMLLNDGSADVVMSAAMAFQKFLQSFPELLLRNPRYQDYIQVILGCLQRKDTVAHYILLGLVGLAEGLSHQDNADCQLAKEPFDLIKYLTEFALVTEESQDVYASFLAITSIMQKTRNTNLALQYMDHLISLYGQHLTQVNSTDKVELRSGILNAFHASLLVLRKEISDDFDQDKIDIAVDKAFQFVETHFATIRDVDSDGIYIISAIAVVSDTNFFKYIDKAYKFLQLGFNKASESVVYKAIMACMSDMVRVVGAQMTIMAQNFADHCFNQIKQNIDRNMKLCILMTLADIISSCDKSIGVHFIDRIFEVIDLCFQGAVDLQDKPEQFDYAEQLKEGVIDFYECVVAGLLENNSGAHARSLFRAHFPKQVQFILITTDTRYNPTVDYIRSCLYLATDTYQHLYALHKQENARPEVHEKLWADLRKNQLTVILERLMGHSPNAQNKELASYFNRCAKPILFR